MFRSKNVTSRTGGSNWPPLVQKTWCHGQGNSTDLPWCKKRDGTDRGSNWPFRCLDVQCVSFAWHVIFLVEDFDETQIRLQYRNASHISASSTVIGLSSLSLLSLFVLLLRLQYCNSITIMTSILQCFTYLCILSCYWIIGSSFYCRSYNTRWWSQTDRQIENKGGSWKYLKFDVTFLHCVYQVWSEG